MRWTDDRGGNVDDRRGSGGGSGGMIVGGGLGTLIIAAIVFFLGGAFRYIEFRQHTAFRKYRRKKRAYHTGKKRSGKWLI